MPHPTYDVTIKVGGLCLLVPDPQQRWIDVLIPRPRGDGHHHHHDVWLGIVHPSGAEQAIDMDGLDVDLTALGWPESGATPIPAEVMELSAIQARASRDTAGGAPPSSLRARARIPYRTGAKLCVGPRWALGRVEKNAALMARWHFPVVPAPSLKGCRKARLPGTGSWTSIPLHGENGPITFYIMHVAPVTSAGGTVGDPNDHFGAFYDLTPAPNSPEPTLREPASGGDLCGEWPLFIPSALAPGYKCILASAEYEP